MFRQVSEANAKQALENLKALVERQTGRKCELVIEKQLDQLADKLARKQLDMAALMVYELAWLRVKDTKLRPLVIAVNGKLPLCAHVLIHKDAPTTSMAQLKDKILAQPKDLPPFCRLFTERQCPKSPQAFFKQITTPPTLEDAIDDVIDGAAAATVVDSLCLESYRRRKPGRATRLKEVQKSIAFPAGAIIYRDGNLPERDLQEFREELLRSKEDADATRLLTLWKLTSFEAVPDHYERTLAAVSKEYPR
jgi:ABC-type phosphate/phosphonate transport system substrate-binding protein